MRWEATVALLGGDEEFLQVEDFPDSQLRVIFQDDSFDEQDHSREFPRKKGDS